MPPLGAMPKISAPTVAEHRERQRAAIMRAGREVAISTEGQGVTFAAVAAQSGLARSSIYEYFGSPSTLLAHVVAEDLAAFANEINDQARPTASPAEHVRAFIRTWLAFIADGRHRLVQIVMGQPMPAECVAAVAQLHAELTRPLTQALTDLGAADPERSAEHIRGIVDATSRRIAAGHPADQEAAAAEEFVLRGLGAGAEPRTTTGQRGTIPDLVYPA